MQKRWMLFFTFSLCIQVLGCIFGFSQCATFSSGFHSWPLCTESYSSFLSMYMVKEYNSLHDWKIILIMITVWHSVVRYYPFVLAKPEPVWIHLFLQNTIKLGWHGGVELSTVASQQKGRTPQVAMFPHKCECLSGCWPVKDVTCILSSSSCGLTLWRLTENVVKDSGWLDEQWTWSGKSIFFVPLCAIIVQRF